MKRHLASILLSLLSLPLFGQDNAENHMALRLQKLESQISSQHQFTAALLEAHSNTKESRDVNRRTRLLQNAPNSVQSTTTIHFQLPEDISDASLELYDVEGKPVRTFRDIRSTGHVTIERNTLTHGTYYYTLIINGKVTETKKMILTR